MMATENATRFKFHTDQDEDAGFSGDEAGMSQKELDMLECKQFVQEGIEGDVSPRKRKRDSKMHPNKTDSDLSHKDFKDKDKGQAIEGDDYENHDDDAGFSGDEAGISQTQLDLLEFKANLSHGKPS